MAVYIISDMHFDDKFILSYENRPFDTVDEMNQTILENWNTTVKEEDVVYVLGDVGSETYISRLNGIKYLVKGNHDTKANEEYRKCGFKEVYDLPVILEDFWILSHEPMYVNSNMPYANLFGHVHANPIYRSVSPQSFCVSVERIGYKPVLLSEIKRQIQEEARKEQNRNET